MAAASEIKLFGKWSFEDVEVCGPSMQPPSGSNELLGS